MKMRNLVTRKYKITPYTEKEDDYLRQNYLQLIDLRLAANMNRTYDSIKKRREFLGLYKKPCKIDPAIEVKKEEIEGEIEMLVNFIEVTKSDVWREIANTRRLTLLKTLKY